eukprot:4484037-Alexandrium_andersonii.AAC.1
MLGPISDSVETARRCTGTRACLLRCVPASALLSVCVCACAVSLPGSMRAGLLALHARYMLVCVLARYGPSAKSACKSPLVCDIASMCPLCWTVACARLLFCSG